MSKKQKRRWKKAIKNFCLRVILPFIAFCVCIALLLIAMKMDYETEVAEGKITEETAASETLNIGGANLALDIPYGLCLEDVYLIAEITYLETGIQGEGYEYVTYLTACVIINRYLDWGYDSIEDVIFDEGQYQTAGTTADEINETTWNAVAEALINTDRNVHFQACDGWLDGCGYELYYDDGTTQIYR